MTKLASKTNDEEDRGKTGDTTTMNIEISDTDSFLSSLTKKFEGEKCAYLKTAGMQYLPV